MNKSLKNTQKLAFGGMMAALVFAATYLFKIPISITQGYIHLGDAFILLGAVLLDWTAIPAAAIGSLLADLIAGYPLYCLPTFLIKAGVAAIAVLGCRKTQSAWIRILWFVLAELWMVLGYFLVEWLPLGYGLAAALGAVGPNLVQGLSGVVIAALLQPPVNACFLAGAVLRPFSFAFAAQVWYTFPVSLGKKNTCRLVVRRGAAVSNPPSCGSSPFPKPGWHTGGMSCEHDSDGFL